MNYCGCFIFSRIFLVFVACMMAICLGCKQANAETQSSKINLGKEIDVAKSRLIAITKFMGYSPTTTQLYKVKNIPQRVMLDQAVHFYNKLRDLHIDIAGEQNYDIIDENVYDQKTNINDIMKKSNNLLADIAKHLKMPLPPLPAINNTRKSPPDIYYDLVFLNKLTNKILEKDAQPADVFQNISLALYISGEILSKMPDLEANTTLPSFIPNKTPEDVYHKLLANLLIINAIETLINNQTILIYDINTSIRVIKPDDVQDIAIIIVSELKHIAGILNVDISNIRSYYPGKKVPSNVFRRATLLQKQLEQIKMFLRENPTWHYVRDN